MKHYEFDDSNTSEGEVRDGYQEHNEAYLDRIAAAEADEHEINRFEGEGGSSW